MKKLILLFVLLLVAGCNEEICNPTAWFMGGTDVQTESDNYAARVGLRNTEGIEVGLETNYSGVRGANQNWGAYAIAELLPDPNSTIIPYIGGHAAIGYDPEDGSSYGPVTGSIVKVGKNVDTVVEFGYFEYSGTQENLNPEVQDQYKIYAGLRIRF